MVYTRSHCHLLTCALCVCVCEARLLAGVSEKVEDDLEQWEVREHHLSTLPRGVLLRDIQCRS